MDSKNMEYLKRFNNMWIHMSEIYKNVDYSASDMCLYYLLDLEDRGEEATQKGFCNAWLINKQTANSAVKRLLDAGYITTRIAEDDRRKKILELTEEGREAARQNVMPVREAELRAFENFTKEESEEMIQLMERIVESFKKEFSKIK